jgi:hypothetical protein
VTGIVESTVFQTAYNVVFPLKYAVEPAVYAGDVAVELVFHPKKVQFVLVGCVVGI